MEQEFDWDKYEMPFVWTFVLTFMYFWISWMLGFYWIPFEWLYDGMVTNHLSFGQTIALDAKEAATISAQLAQDLKNGK